MENDYTVKLDRDGVIIEIKRDVHFYITIPSNTLVKHEYFVGEFRAKNLEDLENQVKYALNNDNIIHVTS